MVVGQRSRKHAGLVAAAMILELLLIRVLAIVGDVFRYVVRSLRGPLVENLGQLGQGLGVSLLAGQVFHLVGILGEVVELE